MSEKSKKRIYNRYGALTAKRISSLLRLMNKLEKKSELKKLNGVNKFFNQFKCS